MQANTINSKYQVLKKSIEDILLYHKRIPKDIINIIISYYTNFKLITNDNESATLLPNGSNDYAYALLFPDGSVETWGNTDKGGNSSSVQHLLKGVIEIHSTRTAFVAITNSVDGVKNVVAWGDSKNGGDCSSVQNKLHNIKSIHTGHYSVLAILADETLVMWGKYRLDNYILKNIKSVHSNGISFAILTDEGNIYRLDYDGKNNVNVVQRQITHVSNIYHNYNSFVAVTETGSIQTWGYYPSGISKDKASTIINVVSVTSSFAAHAALLENKTVVTFGLSAFGGNCDDVQDKLIDIKTIYSTTQAFAALTENGNIITWGGEEYGGDSHGFLLTEEERKIIKIYSNYGAFMAIYDDNTIVTWGDEKFGGKWIFKNEYGNIKSINTTLTSFVILYSSGTMYINGRLLSSMSDIESIYSCPKGIVCIQKNGMIEKIEC